MLKTILRQPMAILGALGFVSLLSGVAKIHEDVRFVIDVFQTLTHPFWEWTLGWFVRWLGLPFPWWVKDYLTMGLIVAGAEARGFFDNIHMLVGRRLTKTEALSVLIKSWDKTLLLMLTWWKTLARNMYLFFRPPSTRLTDEQILDDIASSWGAVADTKGPNTRAELLAIHRAVEGCQKQSREVFFEFLLWGALILTLSYGLFNYDAVK